MIIWVHITARNDHCHGMRVVYIYNPYIQQIKEGNRCKQVFPQEIPQITKCFWKGPQLLMCPQHGIKHKAAINNIKYCVHTVIAAVCFIPFCGHINKHSRQWHQSHYRCCGQIWRQNINEFSRFHTKKTPKPQVQSENIAEGDIEQTEIIFGIVQQDKLFSRRQSEDEIMDQYDVEALVSTCQLGELEDSLLITVIMIGVLRECLLNMEVAHLKQKAEIKAAFQQQTKTSSFNPFYSWFWTGLFRTLKNEIKISGQIGEYNQKTT